MPLGTAIVTAYLRPSRFTDFARSVRVPASQVSAAPAVVDSHGEHVLTAPVERVRWHAVAPVRRPLAAVPGWEVSSLADPHAVHERLVDIVDLPELEV